MFDFRSDTVTKPTQEMRNAMAKAEVGDDVYGEDPTVNALEKRMAEMAGKEAALFSPTGTQSNLLAILAHCQRGEEYIAGQNAHTYLYEGGGAAVLGGLQPQPIDMEDDGSLDLAKVKLYIKEDDYHYAMTKLLCLENTHAGKCLSMEYLENAGRFCQENKLQLHMDGARLFHASVKTQKSVEELSKPVDSVSMCFSKGLGTPMGSILIGSKDFIHRARRLRKMVGGGMRQVGIMAAACHYALDHHVERLADDHYRAQQLAEHLNQYPQLKVNMQWVQTNMVHVEVPEDTVALLNQEAEKMGIRLPSGNKLRLVTHLDITANGIEKAMVLFSRVYG